MGGRRAHAACAPRSTAPWRHRCTGERAAVRCPWVGAAHLHKPSPLAHQHPSPCIMRRDRAVPLLHTVSPRRRHAHTYAAAAGPAMLLGARDAAAAQ